MELILASDHAGFALKSGLVELIQSKEISFLDLGCFGAERVDYPDYAHKLCFEMQRQTDAIGILICGSGQGMAMAANRHKHIRCALCWNTEIAALARAHNHANVLALPGRFMLVGDAWRILDSFLQTSFEGGRHDARVRKIEFLD